jgi:hypothetical protein
MEAAVEEQGRAGRNRQLTERDRELCGFLAVCRYLTREQIERLMFPGRSKARSSTRLRQLGCSQDIADTSDKGQMVTLDEMEVPLCGFTAVDSDADRTESASLMLTISTRPRSTSWK